MRNLTWDGVNAYLIKRVPAVLPLPGKKGISIVAGRGAASLALRIPRPANTNIEPSPYQELTFDVRISDKREVFELSTQTPELFHSFYLFAMAVTRLIEEKRSLPQEAIHEALSQFGQLMVRRTLLSDSVRIGLTGELQLLEALLTVKGAPAFTSWLGPLRERHDFRFGKHEIEVKSTTRTAREHTINGVDQLEPSPGKRLFILSLQYERAGQDAGMTLPQRVYAVRTLIKGSAKMLEEFDGHLARLGYRDADAAFYADSWQLRSTPVLVPVDSNCPRITRGMLNAAAGKELSSRIVDAEYTINISGLGYPEGSSEYRKALPRIRLTKGEE